MISEIHLHTYTAYTVRRLPAFTYTLYTAPALTKDGPAIQPSAITGGCSHRAAVW